MTQTDLKVFLSFIKVSFYNKVSKNLKCQKTNCAGTLIIEQTLSAVVNVLSTISENV